MKQSITPITNSTLEQAQNASAELMASVDLLRIEACCHLEQSQRGEFGQFLTPAAVAELMASMLISPGPNVSILDAGAGVGSLFAAAVAQLCKRSDPPEQIHVTAYEIEPVFVTYLHQTIALCATVCERAGVKFTANVKGIDFIQDVIDLHGDNLSFSSVSGFSVAILNPPYRKINTDSETRRILRKIGIETSNIYTGFLATAVKLLAPDAELITITPRSFCNGTYFRNFRKDFLSEMSLRRIHLFDSRQEAFKEDAVLQETVIVHSLKNAAVPELVTVSSSTGVENELILSREVSYCEIVHPNDSEQFIRVVTDGVSQQIISRMKRFETTLAELGLTVSTGRVVDFRAKEYLQMQPQGDTAPLIYPLNMQGGNIVWPKQTKKAQYLGVSKQTEMQFVPNENYVLVKRFSAKEQKRRIVSAVFEGGRIPGNIVGFENHLNYFHQRGRGMDLLFAKGLAIYLSSTLLDAYFRQFNGHTQVNAADLRNLKYPSHASLERLGSASQGASLTQEQIDLIIKKEFFNMADNSNGDPIATKKRIDEAIEILRLLGLPKAQVNERSALTLLALLDLAPERQWSEASHPMLGITPMMDFMDKQYGKKYAPNSRETVRRQTVHQFLDAGLIIANPDAPERPINSGRTVYQIEASALEMLRTYGNPEWDQTLNAYLASVETLVKRYAQERQMIRIPVQLAPGKTITLSPGGQNILVEQIIHEFAPRYSPGAKMIYVGDTDEKYAYFDTEALVALGVTMDSHGKMPDVIIHYTEKNWLILIEAVTSHGPINAMRQAELKKLFIKSSIGLVLVTAFLSRKAMMQYFPEIAWETEVWLADEPDHMMHFNGERFLGPY